MQPVKFIDSLTPLRGIAALIVVFFHYDAFLMISGFSRLIPLEASSFIARGYLWVDFFFILSGFVICHVYGTKLSAPGEGTIKKYIWARFSRIYPLHAFVMIVLAIHYSVMLVVTPKLAEEWKAFYGLKEFFLQLFFLDAFGLVDHWGWNVPSWSVASEWWIYLVAILIIPFLNKNRKVQTTVAFALGLLGLLLIHLMDTGSAPGTSLGRIAGTFQCLFEFTIGVSVYQIYKTIRDQQTIWSKDWMMFLVVIGVILILHFDVYPVFIIPFFSAFLLCASLNTGLPSRFLNSKPLVFLGDVSYSIYLTHVFWMFSLGRLWVELYFKPTYPGVAPTYVDHFFWLTTMLTFLIGFSYLTYRYVELPAQKKLRSFIR